MNKKDERKILEILGYKPDKDKKYTNEKTASLKGFGRALKTGAIGTVVGATVGINKGYNKINENQNMDTEEKAFHTVAPTVGGALAGAAIGGIAYPMLKSKVGKIGTKVSKLFKTSEFLDELTFIKSASMNIPSEDEIDESKNVSNKNDDMIKSNGLFSSTDKTLDSEYTLQNAIEKKTDVSDVGLGR